MKSLTILCILLMSHVLYGQMIYKAGDVLTLSSGRAGTGSKLIHVDRAGNQRIVSSGQYMMDTFGLTVDANGNAYVASFTMDAIVKVDLSTGSQELVSEGGLLNFPNQITTDKAGNLYVTVHGHTSNGSGDSPAGVVKIDIVTRIQQWVSSGDYFIQPTGLSFNRDDKLVVVRNRITPPQIVEIISPSDHTLLSEGQLLISPVGLTIDEFNNIVIADAGYETYGAIISIDPLTGDQTIISSGGLFHDPNSVAVDSADGTLVVADSAANALFTVNPYTGEQDVLTYIVPYPSGVVILTTEQVVLINDIPEGRHTWLAVVTLMAIVSRSFLNGKTKPK